MGKSTEDLIEKEVRQRLRSMMTSAGVDQGRIELECLYELPPEFVRLYSYLHSQGLNTNPSGSGGAGVGDEGRRVKVNTSRDPMSARTVRAAQGNGKRWSERRDPLRRDAALDERRKLDRRLVRAVEDAVRAAAVRSQNSTSEKADTPGGSTSTTRDCGQCGRRMLRNWVRCPFHE